MGTITESFGNLSDYLSAERKKLKSRGAESELFLSKAVKPFMPSAIRCGQGLLVDVKDREVGPIDIVASLDSFPPFSEGEATAYVVDGVIFCLQIRDWAKSDLSKFAETALQIKKLERKRKEAIPCLAVNFGLIPMPELSQFLGSKTGQSIDGVLCVGHHVIVRNSQGLYGNPARVPYVTESPGPEALKAFTFFLIQAAQSALGKPFGLADYQHL